MLRQILKPVSASNGMCTREFPLVSQRATRFHARSRARPRATSAFDR